MDYKKSWDVILQQQWTAWLMISYLLAYSHYYQQLMKCPRQVRMPNQIDLPKNLSIILSTTVYVKVHAISTNNFRHLVIFHNAPQFILLSG